VKRSKPLPYRLVRVEWEDSARPIPSWQWIDDYKVPQTVICISVGYLIAETNATLALAANLGRGARAGSSEWDNPHPKIRDPGHEPHSRLNRTLASANQDTSTKICPN